MKNSTIWNKFFMQTYYLSFFPELTANLFDFNHEPSLWST